MVAARRAFLRAARAPVLALFYMDAFANRPSLFAMAQRMADFSYTVLPQDLYYRSAPHAQFEPITTFAVPIAHKQIVGSLDALDNDRLRMDAEAFVGWMPSRASMII